MIHPRERLHARVWAFAAPVTVSLITACSGGPALESNPPDLEDAGERPEAVDEPPIEAGVPSEVEIVRGVEPGAPFVDGGTPDTGPDGPLGTWSNLGTGVSYRPVGGGPGVFIAYGGYTALRAYSQAWAQELWRAKLRSLGVGHVYAVKGPADSFYRAKEIGNTSLRTHMKGSIANAAPFVLIGAHSSGAFVAHELLDQLSDASETATLSKIVYANLDGGGVGLNASLVSKLRRVAFVSARDSSLSDGTSANHGTAQDLGEQYDFNGGWLQVVLSQTGCNNGAEWCLHDLLITHRPHNPNFYDLQNDYTDFVNRPVTVEWVDMLSAYLN